MVAVHINGFDFSSLANNNLSVILALEIFDIQNINHKAIFGFPPSRMRVNLRTINKNLNYIKKSYRYYFKEVMDCGSGFQPRSALSG